MFHEMRGDPITKAYIFVREDNESALKLADKTVKFLLERGVDVIRENEQEPQASRGSVVVAIGGDGTLLKAYHITKGRLPIIGVKDGTYGLLMELNEKNLFFGLERLCSGDYEVVTHPSVELVGFDISPAVNEVLLACGIRGKASKISVYVEDILVNKFISDGLIFASPLGTTAYSLSVGGPLLDPRVHALVVTPLTAWPPSMTIPVNSIVLPPSTEVVVKSTRRLVAIIDGQVEVSVGTNARVRLVKEGAMFAHIYREPESFYSRIVERAGRRVNFQP